MGLKGYIVVYDLCIIFPSRSGMGGSTTTGFKSFFGCIGVVMVLVLLSQKWAFLYGFLLCLA